VSPIEIPLSLHGYTALPKGKLASVVTSLEMRRPFPSTVPADPAVLRRVPLPEIDAYRDLYRRIGEPWLWFSRLRMTAAELEATIRDPAVEVFHIVDAELGVAGLVELDRRVAGECELAFFGVVPEAVGKGLGRAAMIETLACVAATDVARFWVHTCTLDHPDALAFYVRAGFQPFARSIEVFDDPRISGVLPRASAPRVPIIG
jgi:GNAT superfamily N-acetyltransferase